MAKSTLLFSLQIVEAMPHTDLVQTFVEKLGDFYELVETQGGAAGGLANGKDMWHKQIPMKSLKSVSAGISKVVPQKSSADSDSSFGKFLFEK